MKFYCHWYYNIQVYSSVKVPKLPLLIGPAGCCSKRCLGTTSKRMILEGQQGFGLKASNSGQGSKAWDSVLSLRALA